VWQRLLDLANAMLLEYVLDMSIVVACDHLLEENTAVLVETKELFNASKKNQIYSRSLTFATLQIDPQTGRSWIDNFASLSYHAFNSYPAVHNEASQSNILYTTNGKLGQLLFEIGWSS
jgi:hypothetical protein